MIVLGIILLIVAWLVPSLGVAVPGPILQLLTVGGWLLIVIGVILLILSFLGRPVGRGLGRGTRRGLYY